MVGPLALGKKRSWILRPHAPYHFDANLRKPSYFPTSDYDWEPGVSWTTMRWRRKRLGLKFEDVGDVDEPRIRVTVHSTSTLSPSYCEGLLGEIRWRFNLDQDISEFCERFRRDAYLGPALQRWRGMKPIAGNSLYETLVIYVVLQNAVIRRSGQMLENLFDRFGRDVRFDGKALSTYWTPQQMATSSEEELRSLKVGYRAKFLLRISQALEEGAVDEFALRGKTKEEVRRAMLQLYGIGPASVEYLLFGNFYFLDGLDVVPPWERKIMSRLLFGTRLVPVERILRFFRDRYPGYEKLAFHYLWEDLFWRRDHETIEWLEREIRR